jgi:hypothetical protein
MKDQDDGYLTGSDTLTCIISNSYSRFSLQQGSGNAAFSANQGTTNTEGAHNIFDQPLN